MSDLKSTILQLRYFILIDKSLTQCDILVCLYVDSAGRSPDTLHTYDYTKVIFFRLITDQMNPRMASTEENRSDTPHR